MRITYLDHAAATYLDPRVKRAMLPWFDRNFGNPGSFHGEGKKARDAVEAARALIAKLLGARLEEILFTSGGTEANNLAILGSARANKNSGKHLITTNAEHPAVLEVFRHLEKAEGFEVTYLPVDKFGQVRAEDVSRVIKNDTILVSIIYANNEIGTINPVPAIGRAIEKHRKDSGRAFPYFHTDACQAAGALDLVVQKLHVDLMTVNAGKIYGPKGAGFLYAKRGVKLEPLMWGGHQERGLRPGTENVPGIVGLAKAFEIAVQERGAESERLTGLRDELITGILKKIPKCRLNGHSKERLPNNVNISILDVEGEALTLYLDAAGIEVSTGSACTSLSLDPSHVIMATGVPYEVAHSSIRFTLGRRTTASDIGTVLKILPGIVTKLRALSPVKLDEKYL
ncbi:MAG: cysteine desulfurase family protein [bacterium]